MRLDPSRRSITGTVAIALAARREDLASVTLDLVDELDCDSVRIAGQVMAFTHGGDSLVVALAQPLAVSESETLLVDWHGQPPQHGHFHAGLMFRSHDAGTPQDESDDVPIIANVSETWSSHSWWPCKDHPSDKALVSLQVEVPDTLSSVSNGRLLEVMDTDPGWRRYTWQESYPLPTYLVSVAVSNYESWQEDCWVTDADPAGEPVSLEYHVFPMDRSNAEHDFAVTCSMMEFITDLLGPYPFSGEKYAQAEIKWGGAMEHTTATSIGQYLFTGDGRYETLIIHELAHQWFGDSLTPGVWADIWLNEGFARYAEALWIEHTLGTEAYREFMLDIGIRRHPTLFEGDGILADPDPILPNLMVYNKGAWVLHMLRMFVGDQAFFTFLADYAARPELVDANVVTPQMIAVAEEAAGRDLSGFFAPWLETDLAPRLAVETTVISGSGGQQVRLRLTQLQEPIFQVAIPVAIHTALGTQREGVELDSRTGEWLWPVAAPLDSVVIDPHGMVLMTLGDGPLAVLKVLGPAPNPVSTAGADFEVYLLESAPVTARLFDVRGRLLTSWDLGVLTATGSADDPESLPHIWSLSSDDFDAGQIASGIYWLEFRGPGSRDIRKLAFVR